MQISNHKIFGVDWVDTPNKSGEIEPKFIVMHYTAGWTASSAINTLKNPSTKASAHVVVDYDGKITQMVPFNIKAWHAGPSRYQGYNGLNSHSIGIEIVNIGWLRKVGNDSYQDAYGNIRSLDHEDLIKAPCARAGSGDFYWPIYKKAQLDAVEELTKELILEYDIIDIVSHEEIDTRGWKTDPGPAFPMNRFKSLIQERGIDYEMYEVISDTPLNVRLGPGTRFGIVMELAKGTPVMVEDVQGSWARINDSHWVHKNYLRKM